MTQGTEVPFTSVHCPSQALHISVPWPAWTQWQARQARTLLTVATGPSPHQCVKMIMAPKPHPRLLGTWVGKSEEGEDIELVLDARTFRFTIGERQGDHWHVARRTVASYGNGGACTYAPRVSDRAWPEKGRMLHASCKAHTIPQALVSCASAPPRAVSSRHLCAYTCLPVRSMWACTRRLSSPRTILTRPMPHPGKLTSTELATSCCFASCCGCPCRWSLDG